MRAKRDRRGPGGIGALSCVGLLAVLILSALIVGVPMGNVSAASPEAWSPTSGELASTDANWADNSKPVAGSTVVFDSTSNVNCTWDLAITVGKFYMNASYTGFVTSTVNWGMTRLNLTSGTLVAGSTTITCAGTWNALYGNFTHDRSTVIISAAGDLYMKAGQKFWNVTHTSGIMYQKSDITVLHNASASGGEWRGEFVNSINNKILYLYGNCTYGGFGFQRWTRIYSYYDGASLWATSTGTTLSEVKVYANCTMGQTESYRWYVAPDVTLSMKNGRFEYFYTYFSYLDNNGLIRKDPSYQFGGTFDNSLFEYTPANPLVWGNISGFGSFSIGYSSAQGGYPTRTWKLGQDFNYPSMGLQAKALPSYSFILDLNGHPVTASYISMDDKASILQGNAPITTTVGGISCYQYWGSHGYGATTATFTQGADVNLAGDLRCYAGWGFKWIQDSHNITVGGRWNLTSGRFQTGTGNVTLTQTGSSAPMGGMYPLEGYYVLATNRSDFFNNLSIEGDVTLTSNITVLNSFESLGKITQGKYRLNISGSSPNVFSEGGSFTGDVYLNGTATSYVVSLAQASTGTVHSNVTTTFINPNGYIVVEPEVSAYGAMHISTMSYSSSGTIADFDYNTAGGNMTFTVRAMPNEYYNLYVDGAFRAKLLANVLGAITWYHDSWSAHNFEVKTITPPYSTPLIEANFTFSVDGMTVKFADASAGPVTQWLWVFDDGTTSTVKDPTHAYLKSGKYVVKLTVLDSAGRSDTVEYTVVVKAETAMGAYSLILPLILIVILVAITVTFKNRYMALGTIIAILLILVAWVMGWFPEASINISFWECVR